MNKKTGDRKIKNLQLSRETLVRLENEDLKKADGGVGRPCTFNPSGCEEVV